MSWFEGQGIRRRTVLALGLVLAAALAGCTVQPLYGRAADSSLDPSLITGPARGVGAARGRIGVSPAGDRTGQIVRNALIFELNGGTLPAAPYLYEVKTVVSGSELVVSIQSGSGVPAASLYRVTVAYEVVRVADAKAVAKGTRFASAPFDRSEQLFAASRALIDAREVAGKDAAARVALAVSVAVAKDLAALPRG